MEKEDGTGSFCYIDLFNEYVKKLGAPHQLANFQTSGFKDYLLHARRSLRAGERREVGFGGNAGHVSEIDIYLNEEILCCDRTDILVWWKVNGERFPVLSKMAKDVLAIPISAVPLWTDLNIDGNVLGEVQSSVSPSVAEALFCTQDWISRSKKLRKVPDDSTELDKLVRDVYFDDTGSESGSNLDDTGSESVSNSEVTSSESRSNSL
ncbi:uncharacterized protein LOC143578406 isoform X2 [Bidens hawaiensis]|uniref:uncharacterized protein LOC143578406 isoform X2 n=1 Tax=Bidens hawaiensis TaxID=980011 RepID=UPI00404B20DD